MEMNQLKEHSKKVYSQNGEDGAIEYIFENIGFDSRVFVEIGASFQENNSLNLIQNYEFFGIFIDNTFPQTFDQDGIVYHKEWVTKDNVNEIISEYHTGDVDFLSIDVDGIDLYLLDAINVISPRVVCIEYCASIGMEPSVTVEYDEEYNRHDKHISGWYCNASLKANINVMKKRGYVFVGTINGLNAFFVRNDCDLGKLKELTCAEGWEPHHHRTYIANHSVEDQIKTIENLNWIEVSEDGKILL